MGMPVYVVNFDELVGEIAVENVEVQIDTSDIKTILDKYFPEIIALLNQLADNGAETAGVQRIKGFSSADGRMAFTPENNIAITGITFSQSDFSGGMDKWSVKAGNGSERIVLLDGLSSKDGLQHKYFERYYPVPAGYEISIEVTNSGGEKTYWCDIEYLELS